MSIPDQDHINRVLLWMSYADEDLVLANYAMKMPGIRSYRLIAFHAQQCAEKYLKAYDRLIINSPYEEPAHYWSYDRKTRFFTLKEGTKRLLNTGEMNKQWMKNVSDTS